MLRNELMVGSIVYFHPERKNEYDAFPFCVGFPFKVIVTKLVGEVIIVKRVDGYDKIEQAVKAEQLSYTGECTEEYTQKEHSDEIGINALIERLEWLAVEQKKISKKELFALFKESNDDRT